MDHGNVKRIVSIDNWQQYASLECLIDWFISNDELLHCRKCQ
jgi:hypothetical protein